MKHRYLTTEDSEIRQELQVFFTSIARAAFADCMTALNAADFYSNVQGKLDRGVDLTADLPESKGMKPAAVKKTVAKLSKDLSKRADATWELEAHLARQFRTTVRSSLPEGERIPQYDVEHVIKTDAGAMKVKIHNWRRNVQVEIEGTDAAVDAAHGLIALAELSKAF
jgi:hypothetical protein